MTPAMLATAASTLRPGKGIRALGQSLPEASTQRGAGGRAQYLWLIGNSSAGNSVITRQPLSVTTTSSSMRAAE
jgi:hypothetical protein